jgi:sugar transferase (PEP-CTERM system associated)
VLVLGTGGAGIALVRELIRRPEFNQHVVGFLDEAGQNLGKRLVNPGIIGAACDVEEIARKENIDRVVISLKERRGATPAPELLRLKFRGVSVEEAHSVFERITGRIMLEHLNPSWLILSEGFSKSRLRLGIKRAVDLAVAMLGLILTAPLMALVAVAIRLESSGAVIFRQPRLGLNERPFQMVKFRSMYAESDRARPSWTEANDRRITRVGKFIRRTRLDELPQFWNVLRGEMSLVGPRPEQPYFCAMLEKDIPHFAQRHSVRPGITGWAQIKYSYGATVEDAKNKLEHDLFYIKHMSPTLDLAIIFETLKVMLSGRGAH